MKKHFIFILLFVMLICLSLTGLTSGDSRVIGVLAYLNLSEEEYSDYVQARIRVTELLFNSGFLRTDSSEQTTSPADEEIQVVFYDSLGEMLMDLNAGRLTAFEVPQSTADYLCSRNHSLMKSFMFDLAHADQFETFITERMSDGFAFMMMDFNTSLCDEFNAAIASMKEDGTVNELIQKHIKDLIIGGSVPAIPLEQKEGRETITVAITGSLPPMDYVGPDGSFGGFNTAILAEIGRRLDKNIELIQVDNFGRAAALASGKADVAFWTRGTPNPEISGMSDADYAAFVEEHKATYSDEENDAMQKLSESLSRIKLDRRDMPDHTIITEPYFIDISVPVTLR